MAEPKTILASVTETIHVADGVHATLAQVLKLVGAEDYESIKVMMHSARLQWIEYSKQRDELNVIIAREMLERAAQLNALLPTEGE